jgi:hypothetical protein
MADGHEGQRKPRLVVRGVDGALYVIPEDRLEEFRLSPEDSQELESQLPPSRQGGPLRSAPPLRPLGVPPRVGPRRGPRLGPVARLGPPPRFRPGRVIVYWQA